MQKNPKWIYQLNFSLIICFLLSGIIGFPLNLPAQTSLPTPIPFPTETPKPTTKLADPTNETTANPTKSPEGKLEPTKIPQTKEPPTISTNPAGNTKESSTPTEEIPEKKPGIKFTVFPLASLGFHQFEQINTQSNGFTPIGISFQFGMGVAVKLLEFAKIFNFSVGLQVQYADKRSASESSIDILSYLIIPLYARFATNHKIGPYLDFGPFLAILLDYRGYGGSKPLNGYQNLDFGLMVGAGVKFEQIPVIGSFRLGLEMQWGLLNIRPTNIPLNAWNRSFYLTLGL